MNGVVQNTEVGVATPNGGVISPDTALNSVANSLSQAAEFGAEQLIDNAHKGEAIGQMAGAIQPQAETLITGTAPQVESKTTTHKGIEPLTQAAGAAEAALTPPAQATAERKPASGMPIPIVKPNQSQRTEQPQLTAPTPPNQEQAPIAQPVVAAEPLDTPTAGLSQPEKQQFYREQAAMVDQKIAERQAQVAKIEAEPGTLAYKIIQFVKELTKEYTDESGQTRSMQRFDAQELKTPDGVEIEIYRLSPTAERMGGHLEQADFMAALTTEERADLENILGQAKESQPAAEPTSSSEMPTTNEGHQLARSFGRRFFEGSRSTVVGEIDRMRQTRDRLMQKLFSSGAKPGTTADVAEVGQLVQSSQAEQAAILDQGEQRAAGTFMATHESVSQIKVPDSGDVATELKPVKEKRLKYEKGIARWSGMLAEFVKAASL